MNLNERLFYGVKRLLQPLHLRRFKLFREVNRLAWTSLKLQDEYLTVTATMAAGMLRVGDVAIDVGANRGIVARAMLKAVGSSGTVHAFEPNPRLVSHLQRIPGLRIHPIALGKAPARLQLFIPEKNDTISSLSYDAVASSATAEELRHVAKVDVEVKTLDSMNMDPVRLIKVDAQGAELDVLLGAEKTVHRCRPVILVEVWSDGLKNFGATGGDVMSWLKKMGYASVRFGGGPTWWDVLAIPHDTSDR